MDLQLILLMMTLIVTINNGPSPEIDNRLSSPEIDEPIVDLYDDHNGGVRNWTKEILVP